MTSVQLLSMLVYSQDPQDRQKCLCHTISNTTFLRQNYGSQEMLTILSDDPAAGRTRTHDPRVSAEPGPERCLAVQTRIQYK